MKMHWLYLKSALRHKWFVFLACLDMGVPIWSAILHDWDKFLPDEFFAYANYFYGKKVEVPNTKVMKGSEFVPFMEPPEHIKRAFDYAWNLHQKRNKHHWQFWLLRNDDPRPTFSFQSHDGGMTHVYIRTLDGEDVAIVYDTAIDWWSPDPKAERQLARELNYVPTALPMPDRARREMIADWIGAGRAYVKDWTLLETSRWYEARKDKIQLHPETRAWVEQQLELLAQRYRTEQLFKAGVFG